MNKTWWISDSKLYQPTTKQWFCHRCAEVQPIERNPAWNGELKRQSPAPEWFVRCATCKHTLFNLECVCPECGTPTGEEEIDGINFISATKPILNYAAQMEFGGNPVDWEETHRCQNCQTVYMISNSNY